VAPSALPASERRALYARYLEEAARLSEAQSGEAGELHRLDAEAGELQYFVLPTSSQRKES
jgi:hypothetical protein